MFSAAAPRRRRFLLAGLALLVWGLGVPSGASATDAAIELPPPRAPEAWLVTYGPGEIYWQRFGHNAIWLREPGGLNHTFNFGFFDFEQENFLLRFVQGRMLYFAAAVPAEREMALYRSEGREIRAQRLDLGPEAYRRLKRHLVWHVQPENREYLYDYYLDNCSTRLRDALDLALGGDLARRYGDRPAAQNFRSHTRRATLADRDYYLGLMTGLGLPVDRPISRWDEMFLPAVLADGVGAMERERDGVGKPLVTRDIVLSPARVAPPPPEPGRTWPAFGLLGIVLAGLAWGLARWSRPAAGKGLALGWLAVAGTLGLGLAALWAFTDHAAAAPNFNLLLINPLWLLALVPALRQAVAVLLVAGAGLAVLAGLWPAGQYLADTLALFLPLNLAAAAWLRRPPPPAGG